jgi:hypothetical protein
MERRYRLLVAGEYAAARVPPPVSGPSVYRRLALAAFDRAGLAPLGDPEALAEAYGLHVVWGYSPGKHGIYYEDTVIVSPLPDPLESAFVVTHELAHAILREHGAPHATEADAMWLTLELSLPSWLHHADARFCPAWLKRIRPCKCRDCAHVSENSNH